MENKKDLLKKIFTKENISFIMTGMLVPVFIGIFTSYISFKLDKPKEYFIRETFDLDKLNVTDYFPLKKGNYWIYSRDISYHNGNEIQEINDKVKVEVVNYYKSGENELFVMKGDPLEYDSKKAENINYGYIIISNKIVKVPNERINFIIKKFINKESIDTDETEGLYVEYEFPLFNGQKYGDFEFIFSHHAKNINYVTKLLPYRKKVGENIMDIGVYQIDSLYNSGDEQKIFTPYTGVTEYSYEHRGTTEKYLIELIEYKINED